MAAKSEHAKRGYEFFLKERGKVSLAEINKYLARHGEGQIANRTYEHYRRLIANGFRYYIPINHLDVYLSLGGDRIIAERRRFSRQPGGEAVMFSFDKTTWLQAATLDVSGVGFGLVTNINIKNKPLSPITIRLTGHRDIPGSLAWKRNEGTFTRLGVRVNNFISTYLETETGVVEIPRPLGKLTIARTEEGQIDWQKFAMVVHRTNQFMLALEELIYLISSQSGQKLILARPVLESIEFHSPGVAPVSLDREAANLAKLLIDHIFFPRLEIRKRVAGARAKEAEASKVEAEAQQVSAETRKTIAEAEQIELEVLKANIELVEILAPEEKQGAISLLRSHFVSVFGEEAIPDNFLGPGTPELAVLEKKVIPRGMEMFDTDDPEFKYYIEEDA